MDMFGFIKKLTADPSYDSSSKSTPNLKNATVSHKSKYEEYILGEDKYNYKYICPKCGKGYNTHPPKDKYHDKGMCPKCYQYVRESIYYILLNIVKDSMPKEELYKSFYLKDKLNIYREEYRKWELNNHYEWEKLTKYLKKRGTIKKDEFHVTAKNSFLGKCFKKYYASLQGEVYFSRTLYCQKNKPAEFTKDEVEQIKKLEKCIGIELADKKYDNSKLKSRYFLEEIKEIKKSHEGKDSVFCCSECKSLIEPILLDYYFYPFRYEECEEIKNKKCPICGKFGIIGTHEQGGYSVVEYYDKILNPLLYKNNSYDWDHFWH